MPNSLLVTALGGRMRILAAIHPPEATRDILECLGLPSRAPPTAPAPLPVPPSSVEPEIDAIALSGPKISA